MIKMKALESAQDGKLSQIISFFAGSIAALIFVTFLGWLEYAPTKIPSSLETILIIYAIELALVSLLYLLPNIRANIYLRRLAVLVIITAMISAIVANLVEFKDIEEAENHKVRTRASGSLTDMMISVPDYYPGKELLHWLRNHAEGATLLANQGTLNSTGLVTHRLIGISHIKVLPAKNHTKLKNFQKGSKQFVHFKIGQALKTLLIDTENVRPGSILCADSLTDSVVIYACNG